MTVYRQPEVGDVRRGKVGQALVLLPPAARQLRAFCGENLKNSVHQAAQIIVGPYLEKRRNKAGIQAEGASLRSFHIGNAQSGRSLAGFIGRQQAKVLACNLDRPLPGPGVVVPHIGNLGQIAGTGHATQTGDVESFQLVIGNSQINVQVANSRIEKLRQRLRRRRLIRAGNLEEQSVGEDTRGARNGQLALRQQFLIEHNLAEPPGAKLQRL